MAETQNSRANLAMLVAKIIQQQKEYGCIGFLAILLYGQNRLDLFKGIGHNESHLGFRCFARLILPSQILNNGLSSIYKTPKSLPRKDGCRKAQYQV